MKWYVEATINILRKKFPSLNNAEYEYAQVVECFQHFKTHYGALEANSVVHFLAHLIRRFNQLKNPQSVWPYIIPILLVAKKIDNEFVIDNFEWIMDTDEIQNLHALYSEKNELERALEEASSKAEENKLQKSIITKRTEIKEYRNFIEKLRETRADLSAIPAKTLNEMERLHLSALNYKLGVGLKEIFQLSSLLEKDHYATLVRYYATEPVIVGVSGDLVEDISNCINILAVFADDQKKLDLIKKAHTSLHELKQTFGVPLNKDDLLLEFQKLKQIVFKIIGKVYHPNGYDLFFKCIASEDRMHLDQLLMKWYDNKVAEIKECKKKVIVQQKELAQLEAKYQQVAKEYKRLTDYVKNEKNPLVIDRFIKPRTNELDKLTAQITLKKRELANVENIIKKYQPTLLQQSFQAAKPNTITTAAAFWQNKCKPLAMKADDSNVNTMMAVKVC